MKRRKKLAIISTHPIQYNAPLFALISESKIIQTKVFYTWSQSQKSVEDRDFQQTIEWDIPLLEGYEYEFVSNHSKDPGIHHFRGLVNPELIKRIKSWNPDGILVYGWNFHSHLKTMRYFKNRVPIYFRGDSTLLDERSGIKKILRRIFLKWVYYHVDAAFYVGENNKAYFKTHGLKSGELFFAPHAIDNIRFDPDLNKQREKAAKMRENLGVKPDERIFLFVGKFEPKKDPVTLIRAFNEINHNKTHLVMVGNGPEYTQIAKIASRNDCIHLLPFQNQSKMPSIYQMADLLVLPSKGPGETWGLVVNEAMASGMPVLVSDMVGCNLDLVKDKGNGRIFTAGDINSLKSNLEFLAYSPELQHMGIRSKEIIKDWSFLSIKKSLEENCFNA